MGEDWVGPLEGWALKDFLDTEMATDETHVLKMTNTPVFIWHLGLKNDFGVGKSITWSTGRGGPRNVFARIKNHYVLRQINNRYINSFKVTIPR
jgi:hypothetical protein